MQIAGKQLKDNSLDIAKLTSSTLAEVNAKVSDANLVDTGDARFSDSRDCYSDHETGWGCGRRGRYR
jgi:hypothetical protein